MSSARAGDDARRALSLDDLDALPDPSRAVALGEGYAGSIRAEALRVAGRPAAALAELERGARATPFVVAWTSGFVSQAYERYARAELLHALGRDVEALRWYETLGENSPYDLVYLAPSLYRQARIHEARGERAAAAERYARFVALWKACDPELRPLTADARARLARLR
jgi:tetratricopeptide (TPR) repeat protein